MSKSEGRTYLAIAAGSLLFYTIGLPILDAASSWIQNQFSYHNAKLQDKLNKETNQPTSEANNVQAIGFQCTCEECEEEDE